MCTSIELKKAINELVKATVAISSDVYKIILFGSYARGENTEESDVDIMIILDCSPEEVKRRRKEFSKIASRIGLNHDLLFAVLLRSKEDFVANLDNKPLYKNVLTEGVELYGMTTESDS